MRKSYLLRKLFRDYLIKSGVDPDHICVYEFPRSSDRSICSPDVLFADLKKRLPGTGRCYLLLDNVEYLSDAAQVLNSLSREDRLDVYDTVNHASGFTTDVPTVFRGRGDAVHVFPLSFAEFMSGFDGGLHEAWAQYSRYGGMPAVVALESEEEKRSRLTSFLKDACAADMVGQYGVGKTRELEALIRVVASCMGKFIDPTQVAKQSTNGAAVTVNTVGCYLKQLEDAFLITSARRYDIKRKRRFGSPVKFFFDDVGLCGVARGFDTTPNQAVLENVVFTELRMRGYEVELGSVLKRKVRNGRSLAEQLEVSFVTNRLSRRIYVQVADESSGEFGVRAQKAALMAIRDSFKKIIVLGRPIVPAYDEEGIFYVGFLDFLLKPEMLLW